jgi:TRAP-type C4-dicarboxylate transport system permease small subunit
VSLPRASSSLVDKGFRALEALLVLMLAAMVVMVFANVVLRYGFGSGITVSEEISRFLFVWLIFLGSVPVMRQHGHLGVEVLVGKLSAAGRRVARAVSDFFVLGCCVVFGWGAWEQTQLNMANLAPVSGLPTGWTYAAAVVCATGIGVLTLADLVHTVVLGRAPEVMADHGYEP